MGEVGRVGVNHIGIRFNCGLPGILDASQRVMKMTNIYPLSGGRPLSSHIAIRLSQPRSQEGRKRVSRSCGRVRAGLGSCQLLHSQHSWEGRLREELWDTQVVPDTQVLPLRSPVPERQRGHLGWGTEKNTWMGLKKPQGYKTIPSQLCSSAGANPSYWGT